MINKLTNHICFYNYYHTYIHKYIIKESAQCACHQNYSCDLKKKNKKNIDYEQLRTLVSSYL